MAGMTPVEGLTVDAKTEPPSRGEWSTAPPLPDAEQDGRPGLPLFGYPGFNFYLIHGTADFSICISIVCSVGVLVYIFSRKPYRSLWKRSISERLVAYLAMGDFLFSSSHLIDHTALMVLEAQPGDTACAAMAFLLIWFWLAQSIIVTFTAVNAAVMVILQRKLVLGAFDWKLLVAALGLPAAIGVLGLAYNVWGQSGAWCFVDMRQSFGPLIGNIITDYMLCVIAVMVLSYGAVWFRIKSSAKVAPAASNKTSKYNNSAKVMTVFVAAYIFQQFPVLVQGFYVIIFSPFLPMWLIVTMVAVGNLGGLYNMLTYTVIRNWFTTRRRDGEEGASTTGTTGTAGNTATTRDL